MKPFYTYDSEADVLYVLLVEESEPAIDRTEELAPTLHVDLDTDGTVVGVEFPIQLRGMKSVRFLWLKCG